MSWRLLLFVGILLSACMAPKTENNGEPGSSVPAVYTRYLTYPIPSAGIQAEFNPPVLRWPLAKGASVRYDVRLSMDSLFNDKVFTASETPWAMFNPHVKLDPGDWFWQYRVSGGQWSAVHRFAIDATAIDLVSPSAERFLSAIPDVHPRVLASGRDVSTIRTLRDEADARMIQKEADAILKMSIPRETDGQSTRSDEDKDRARKLRQDASNALGKSVFTAVNTLCQAWVLTGDRRYAERAVAIAKEVATWDPQGVTGSETNDFSDARCMLTTALVFDTFYEELSPSERSLLARAARARAEGFYQSWINNQEARVLSGHVWQHILHYFFQAALALHGHEAQADDWLAYAYELFLARAPILGGTEGGWIEGVSYFKMNMETLIEIPLFIKEYAGFDFINAHPWYQNNALWMIYHIPPGSSSDGFGDNSEEVSSPGAKYIAYAGELAKLTGNPLASWYASACQQYEKPDLAAEPTLRWVRLTKTRGLQAPEPPTHPELPTAMTYADIGMLSMHADPANTREDFAVALRSSPFGCYGHFLADQNAFNILYGGKKTFFRTGYKVTMSDPHRTGWYQHTKSNNSVLINGEGQPYSTEAYGWIRESVHGQQLAYALADASNAYSSQETGEDHGVRKFFRHIILLKPDILVIYDDLESVAPAEWSWLIHSMTEIETNTSDNSFSSIFDHAKGIGKLWATAPIEFVLRDTFDVPAVNWRGAKNEGGKLKTYEENQWHLRAITAEKARKMRFLAVLQVSDRADLENISEVVDGSDVEISVGSWTVSAELDAGAPAELSIAREDGTTTFRFAPGTPATLTEVTGGREEKKTATDQMPWMLKQRALVYIQEDHHQ